MSHIAHSPTKAQRKEAEEYMRSSVWASHIVVSGAAPGIYLAALQGPTVQKLVDALEFITRGPTYGPGAPTLEEQSKMDRDRAREALKEFIGGPQWRGVM